MTFLGHLERQQDRFPPQARRDCRARIIGHFCQTSFVAEQDGHVVGFVVGFVSQSYPDEGYIHFVGVHPGLRKGGLGHLLYERVFEAMIRVGYRNFAWGSNRRSQQR